jgi:hypothetical protein
MLVSAAAVRCQKKAGVTVQSCARAHLPTTRNTCVRTSLTPLLPSTPVLSLAPSDNTLPPGPAPVGVGT